MDDTMKHLVDSLQKAKNERRFILDFSFPIKKITHCEMCGTACDDGEKYVRGWFEVGRQVYGSWSNESKKGITICSKHERKEMVGFIVSFVAYHRQRDAVLSQGELIWDFRNDNASNTHVLEKVLTDLEPFKDFLMTYNRRFIRKVTDKRIVVDKMVFENIVNMFYSCLLHKEFQVYDDNMFSVKMSEVQASVDATLLCKCQKSRRNTNATVKRVSELLSEVSVVRFIYLKEIPTNGVLQRKIINYVNIWGGMELSHAHKENIDRNEKVKALESIITKIEDNLVIAKQLIQILRGKNGFGNSGK